MNTINILKLDHLGIRVTNLKIAVDFYSIFGFKIDASENLHSYHACALQHECGLRINLIYNAADRQGENILLDSKIKHSGITHVALVVNNITETQNRLKKQGITITEGPLKINQRRIICFVRDPDGNVIELNQLL